MMNKKLLMTLTVGAGTLLGMTQTVKATQLTTVGDSITAGYISTGNYKTPYGQYASNQLKMDYQTVSKAGNMFVANYPKYPDNYLGNILSKNKSAIQNADIITILEGTNDYQRNSSLENIKKYMIKDIQTIQSLNPKAKILGILPLNRWGDFGQNDTMSSLSISNHAGYTLSDLINVEKEVYHSFNIPYVTLDEMGYTLTPDETVDGLHPNPTAHQKIGKALANYLSVNYTTDSHASGYVKTNDNVPMYQSLTLNQKKTSNSDYTYRVNWQYHHVNGKDYLSLYNSKNEWQGYVEKNKTTPTIYFHHKTQYATLTKDVSYYKTKKFNTIAGKLGKHQTLMSKGYYQYKGNTYYSLYDRHDNWKGYVNAKDVKISSSKGGSYCSNKQSYITVKSKDYQLLQELNNKSTKRPLKYSTESFYTKGHYHDFVKGYTYYSLYKIINGKSVWQGYMNKNNLQFHSDDFGAFHRYTNNKTFTIKKSGYGIFKDKHFKKKTHDSKNLINHKYRVAGYYDRIMGGGRYYSIYYKNTWIGYIKSTAGTLK